MPREVAKEFLDFAGGATARRNLWMRRWLWGQLWQGGGFVGDTRGGEKVKLKRKT
jgi:hypothetical protein